MMNVNYQILAFVLTSFIVIEAGKNELEFMENTGTFLVEKNEREKDLLRELLGKPLQDASKAKAVRSGIPNKSKMKINCHHVSEGTSSKRMKILMSLCPKLREKEYKKKSSKVAKILQEARNSTKSFDEQKKDFFNAVHEMARAAGHLPSLTFH